MKKKLYFKYNQNINNQLSFFLKTYKITKLTDVLVNLDNIKQPHPFGPEGNRLPKGPGGTFIEPTVTSELLTHKKYLTYRLPYPFGPFVSQYMPPPLGPLWGKILWEEMATDCADKEAGALPEGAKGGARFSIYAPKGAMVKLIKIKPTQRTYQFLQNILTKYLTTVSNEHQLSLPLRGKAKQQRPFGPLLCLKAPEGAFQTNKVPTDEGTYHWRSQWLLQRPFGQLKAPKGGTFGPPLAIYREKAPKGGGVGPEYLIFSKINAKTFLSYWLIPLTGLAIYGPGLNTTKTHQTEQLGGIYSFNCLSLSALSLLSAPQAYIAQRPEGARATFRPLGNICLRGERYSEIRQANSLRQLALTTGVPSYLQPLTNLNVFSVQHGNILPLVGFAETRCGRLSDSYVPPLGIYCPKGAQSISFVNKRPFGQYIAGLPRPKGPQRSPQALVSVAPLVSPKILNTNSSYITSDNCFKLLESKLSFYRLPPFRGAFGYLFRPAIYAQRGPKGNEQSGLRARCLSARSVSLCFSRLRDAKPKTNESFQPEQRGPGQRGPGGLYIAQTARALWPLASRPASGRSEGDFLKANGALQSVVQTQKNFKTLNLSTIPVTNQTLAYKLLFNNIQPSCPEGKTTRIYAQRAERMQGTYALFSDPPGRRGVVGNVDKANLLVEANSMEAFSLSPLWGARKEDLAYLQRSPDLDLIMFIFSQMVNNQKNANFFNTRAKIQYPLKLKINLNKTKIQPSSVGTAQYITSSFLNGGQRWNICPKGPKGQRDPRPKTLQRSSKGAQYMPGGASLAESSGVTDCAQYITAKRPERGPFGHILPQRGAERTLSFKHQKMFKTSSQTRLDLQKKRKAKKQRLETRRQKKRTRFFPRPVWLRNRMFLTFINKRTLVKLTKKNMLAKPIAFRALFGPSLFGRATRAQRAFQPFGHILPIRHTAPFWAPGQRGPFGHILPSRPEGLKGQLLANSPEGNRLFFAKGTLVKLTELALRTNQRFKAQSPLGIDRQTLKDKLNIFRLEEAKVFRLKVGLKAILDQALWRNKSTLVERKYLVSVTNSIGSPQAFAPSGAFSYPPGQRAEGNHQLPQRGPLYIAQKGPRGFQTVMRPRGFQTVMCPKQRGPFGLLCLKGPEGKDQLADTSPAKRETRDSLTAPLGSPKKAVNFLFKKQFLHNLKIKANYVNFKNQKTTNPAQIDKEKDKDTMFRAFWIWFYNNTVINKPDPPSNDQRSPQYMPEGGPYFSKQMQNAFKVTQLHWALNKTNINVVTDYNKRYNLWGSQKLRNQSKNNKTKYLEKQFRTNWERLLAEPTAKCIFLNKNLSKFYKKISSKLQQKTQKLNYLTTNNIAKNNQFIKTNTISYHTASLSESSCPPGQRALGPGGQEKVVNKGPNIKNIIQVNNAWWASLQLSPLRGNIILQYIVESLGGINQFLNTKNTEIPPMSNQQVFMISTILLHFCAVVSLISISQVRCFVKFHLILLYKLSNLYNTLIKKMSEMISAVGTNFHNIFVAQRGPKGLTPLRANIAFMPYLKQQRGPSKAIGKPRQRAALREFKAKPVIQGAIYAHSFQTKMSGVSRYRSTIYCARNKLERYLQLTPQSQFQTNNKLLTFFSLNLLKKDFKLLSTFSNNKGSYPQSACSFGHILPCQPKGGTKVNLISLKSAISLSPACGSEARIPRLVGFAETRCPTTWDGMRGPFGHILHIYYPPGPIANTRAKSLQNPKGVIYTRGQTAFQTKKWASFGQYKMLTTKKDYPIKQLKYFITKYTLGFPFGAFGFSLCSNLWSTFYAQRAQRLRASKKAVSLRQLALNLLLVRNIIFYLIDLFQSVVYLLKSFFEKPTEFTTSWIAFGFLVEWSSDLITIIPENVDIYIWNTFFKTSRLIPFYTSLNYLSFSTVTNLFNPVIYGNFLPQSGTQYMPTRVGPFGQYNAAIYREGAGVPMFFLLSHLLQRRILYLFDTFIFTISHPDTDLIRRQQKGTLFWDVWADFLVTAADYYNINVAALSTIKNEQNSLIENISNNSKQEFYKFFSKKTYTKKLFNNQIARNILIKKTQTVTLQAYWQSQLNNEKGPESVNQYITYQSWHSHNGTNNSNGDLFIDYHPPKAFSHIPAIKYTNILQQPLGTLVCQIYSGLFNSKISKNILLIKPKILSNLKTAKNTAIRSPAFRQKRAAEGASTDYNILLIQALAGETELKIITDNAQRYALVNRGFAIGIKLLRDVFDAIALNTPCIFLLLDIHAIGERRPMLISDYGGKNSDDNSAFKEDFFASIRDEVHEKNQVVYQLTRHALTHYQKPFKGDYSQIIPTNLFVALKGGDLFLKTPAQSLPYIAPEGALPLQQSVTLRAAIDAQRGGLSSKNFKNYYILSHLQLLKQKSKMSPPSTSPFTVLLLKEEKKLKPNKIVEEFPWIGLPAEQLSTKPRTSYSIRAKVSMLAELSLSNLSAKLDMITDLLVIIDSVRSNKGFVVFATTDTPQILDPALRRPGRLDETLTLPLWGPNLLNTTNYEIFKYIKPILNHNLTILNEKLFYPKGAVSLTNVRPAFINFAGCAMSAFASLPGGQSNLFPEGAHNVPFGHILRGATTTDKGTYDQSKKGHILSKLRPKFTVNVNNYNMTISAQRAERGILNYALISHTRNLKELSAPLWHGAARLSPQGTATRRLCRNTLSHNVGWDARDSYVQVPIQRAYIDNILPQRGRRAGKKVLTHLGGLSPSPEGAKAESQRAPKGPKSKLKDSTYYQVGKALLTTYGSSLFPVALPFGQRLTGPEGLKGLSDREAFQTVMHDSLPCPPGLVKQLMLLFSGTITQLLATQQISKLNNYLAPSAIYAPRAVRGEHKLSALPLSVTPKQRGAFGLLCLKGPEGATTTDQTPLGVGSFGLSGPFRIGVVTQYMPKGAVRGEMHKSYLYKKNLIVPKLLSFLNNTVLEQPPSPPFSSLLIPAKRFENYNRVVNNNVFGDKMGQRQAQITFVEKLQSHMSHFGAISLLKNKTSSLSLDPEGTLRRGPIRGMKAPGYSDYQTFLKNMPNEQKLQTATNINWYYQNRILKRHGQYLTNQWWNGQLSEHNTETVFLSDIDWRSSFITKPGGQLPLRGNLLRAARAAIYAQRAVQGQSGTALGAYIVSKTKNLYTLSTSPALRDHNVGVVAPLGQKQYMPKGGLPGPKGPSLFAVEGLGDTTTLDVLLDFPDTEQYYNPRQRRWLLNCGDWDFWFNFDRCAMTSSGPFGAGRLDKVSSEEIMYTCILESIILTYNYLYNNLELLDFITTKCLVFGTSVPQTNFKTENNLDLIYSQKRYNQNFVLCLKEIILTTAVKRF